MIIATFTLTFPDGAIAKAQLEAESADAEYNVVYSRAVDRLPERFETVDVRVGEERREGDRSGSQRADRRGI